MAEQEKKMMDVRQDGSVRFPLTDSSDESTSLITAEELSFLKARGVGKTMENNNWKSCTCTPTANLSSIREEIKNKV